MKKVILITGASSGIGKATALQLISEGHTVYGAARRVEKMKDLSDKGGHVIGMDITDISQIKAAVAQIIEVHGKIDVLINNAGYAIYGAVEDTSIEDVKRQFDVNFFGLVELTQEVLPHMRKAGNGQIINLSSMGGKIYTPLGAFYHATKHAIEGYSDALRLELNTKGIDVVIIEPGLISTEFADVLVAPLLERSGKSAYGELAQKIAKATKESTNMSSPNVIAKTISKAVSSSKPKTRYAAGKMAKPLIFMRRILSDRMFDKMVMSQVK